MLLFVTVTVYVLLCHSSVGAANNNTATSLYSASGSEVMHLDSDGDIDALLASGPTHKVKMAEPNSGTGAGRGRGPVRRLKSSSEDSDSGHNPNTFSDEATRELARTMSSLSGLTGVSAAQATDTTVSSGSRDAEDTVNTPGNGAGATSGTLASASAESPSSKGPYRMRAHEALQIGLILSQQEQEFGTNMYQSLTPPDEPAIERLNSLGFSTEEAILKIFQKRFQPHLMDHEVRAAVVIPPIFLSNVLAEEMSAMSCVYFADYCAALLLRA
jgi:hypothetical protein